MRSNIMENKEPFKFQGNEFRFTENNLLLRKKSNRLLKKYFSLEAEFTGDIDTKLIDDYDIKLTEFYTGRNQCNKMLEQELSKDEKADYEIRLQNFQNDIDKTEAKKDADLKVRAIQSQLDKCRGLILTEIIEDYDFIKPLFDEILIGDHSKLDYSSDEIGVFIMEVITDFFGYTLKSKNKS